jgi:transposase
MKWMPRILDNEKLRSVCGMSFGLVTRSRSCQARARPLIDDLHHWFNKTLAGLSRKSDTAVVIRYALSRWRALGRFLDDGHIEMDNSAAERAAAIYSLLGTAKLNGLDPELYLRHVLERIADHPVNRLHELLPWNLATASPTYLS